MPGIGPIDVHDLGSYIRDQRNLAQISVRQLAKAAGVSNPYLSQIERGLRRPSAEILQQIANGLRISAEALYVRAGILDERVADSDIPAAIAADVTVTERQKQVLLEIYSSFRHENDVRRVSHGTTDDGVGSPTGELARDVDIATAAVHAVAADAAPHRPGTAGA